MVRAKNYETASTFQILYYYRLLHCTFMYAFRLIFVLSVFAATAYQ